ncbi:MAG: 50S ribosomal protein L25/general stress protein Ctc [Pseudomonadota bacterium]
MSDPVSLTVTPRERAGKGAARAARRDGLLPAVIYGDKRPPVPVNLSYHEVFLKLHKPGFYTTLYDLKVGSKKERVLARAVQFDPVKDVPIHVDFLRVAKGATVTIQVPVAFINEEAAPGLKEGGVLNVVRHEIGLVCPADAMPDTLEVDLTGLQLGDSVHISAVTLPEGSEPEISDRDFTIATIAVPSAVRSEAEDAAEGEEGEAEAEGEEEGGEEKE